jgi:CHASE3 domain sensor protein
MTKQIPSQTATQPGGVQPGGVSSPRFLSLLQDLKIAQKLAIGFGVLVVLIFLSAGVSYLGSQQAMTKIDRTDEVRVPTALAASRAQADLLRALADVRGYLALGEKTYRDSYVTSLHAFEADLTELDRSAPQMSVENQQRLSDLKYAYKKWLALPDHLFELRDDQLDREPAYRLLATTGTQFAGQVLIDVNQLIELQGQREPTAENLDRLRDMAKFQGNFAAMLSAMRGYVTTRNRIYRGEYEVNLVDNQNAWDRLRRKRDELTDAQKSRIDSIEQDRAAFLALREQIFEDLEGERWREDLYLFSTEALPLASEMQRLLGELVVNQQEILTQELAAGRQDLYNTNRMILGGGVVALLFGLAMAYFAQQTIAGPVRRLTSVAERIRGGDLEAQAAVEAKDEIGILAITFNNMTAQLRRTLLQVRKEKKRADDLLDVVIPIGVDLASEKDFNRLLENMLLEAKSFCRANAGTLYLKTEDDHLKYVIMRDDIAQVALGGTTGQDVPFAPVALYQKDGQPNDRVLAVRVALEGATINITDADQLKDQFDFSGASDSRVYTDQVATSLLAIPLKNSEGQVLGVMQLMNPQDPESKQVVSFDQNLQRMMESFSSLAVAALEAYIREQALKQEIQQLRIEIDEAKRQQQVSEIVDTDFFQDLRAKAQSLRQRGRQKGTE